MPRRPQPWYKTSHKAWYVKIDGKQIRLAEDEDEAWKAFHQLMASGKPEASPATPPARGKLVAMFDAWLGSKAGLRPKTIELNRQYAQSFLNSMPASARAADVRITHVNAWLAKHPAWSRSTRQIAVRAVKAAFRWGELEGWVAKDPLARLKTPPADVRPPVDLNVVEMVLSEVSDLAKEILLFMYFTGARPGEAISVEASGIDAERGTVRVVGKMGERRVVAPSEYLAGLLELAKGRPTGPLFRNGKGDPWTIDAIESQLRRARQRLGITARFVPYHLRGVFASGRIAAGVGDSLVGKMLGHSNPYTLHRHYHNPDLATLREAIDREIPGRVKNPGEGRGEEGSG